MEVEIVDFEPQFRQEFTYKREIDKFAVRQSKLILYKC